MSKIPMTEQELEVLRKYIPKTQVDNFIQYDAQTKTLTLFIEDCEKDKIIGRPTNFMYIFYWYFCRERGEEPLAQIEFSRRITKHFGLTITDKKIKGVKYRIFQSVQS